MNSKIFGVLFLIASYNLFAMQNEAEYVQRRQLYIQKAGQLFDAAIPQKSNSKIPQKDLCLAKSIVHTIENNYEDGVTLNLAKDKLMFANLVFAMEQGQLKYDTKFKGFFKALGIFFNDNASLEISPNQKIKSQPKLDNIQLHKITSAKESDNRQVKVSDKGFKRVFFTAANLRRYAIGAVVGLAAGYALSSWLNR